jgi:integrase
MTDEEVASLGEGGATSTLEELTVLYAYATDRGKVLMLLGLNCGFARAECVSLRIDDIAWQGDVTCIRRVRRKSRVWGEWCLWPETVKALEWTARERAVVAPQGNTLVVLSDRGTPISSHRVANHWTKLPDRVQKDHRRFRRLPHTHLWTTSAGYSLSLTWNLSVVSMSYSMPSVGTPPNPVA